MGNEQRIIDKIMADAQAEADNILEEAKHQAALVIKKAEEKAEKEMSSYRKLAEAEARKASSKEISGADMSSKKRVLAQKQEILEEVISQAQSKLLNLSDDEYEETIIGMAETSEGGEGSEILLSDKDKKRLGNKLKEKGFTVSDETRDISGGFIVRNGDIEYNYSFEAIIAVEREEIEQIAAEILFG